MKIVCFGDSLTRGTYGGSYFDSLATALPQHTFGNAGRNGDTVHDLLARVDEVITLAPEGVFLMVGGNEAISFSQPKTRPYYRKSKALPEGYVTPDLFSATYRELLFQLQLAGLLIWIGLPPAEHNPAVRAAFLAFNHLASQAATSYRLPVLDLMSAFAPQPPPPRPDLDLGTILTIGRREAEGWSDYESARRAGGYTFTFDGLHLTPEAAHRAGLLIAALIQS